MKRSEIVLGVALVGAVAALLAYDRLVLERRAAAQTATLAKATEVNLSKARSEAGQIAADLDASVDRSVANRAKRWARWPRSRNSAGWRPMR